MLRFYNTPILKSNLRILHACPLKKSINVFLNGKLAIGNCSFGQASKYLSLKPGKYTLEVFSVEDNTKPIFKYIFEAIPRESVTLSIACSDGLIKAIKLVDSPSSNLNNTKISKLRFINLSSNLPLLNLSLPNNKVLFKDVEFLEETLYHSLSSGIYNFKLSFSSAQGLNKLLKNITLSEDYCYTIYIIGLLNGKPNLGYLILKDF